MTQILIANWKMHSPNLADWVAKVAPASVGSPHEIVLCPPFTQLAAAQMLCERAGLALGAQDCHAQPEGAFTGDISAAMLQRAGCEYVILGHSERRHYHGETDAQVQQKAQAALTLELTPIICIGETLQEYEAGDTLAVLKRQVDACIRPLATAGGAMIIAYEPIWAIGSGRTPSQADIAAAHAHIKKQLERPLPVVYGGSVKPSNAAEILAVPGVDGALVGGASLKPEDFALIIQAGR